MSSYSDDLQYQLDLDRERDNAEHQRRLEDNERQHQIERQAEQDRLHQIDLEEDERRRLLEQETYDKQQDLNRERIEEGRYRQHDPLFAQEGQDYPPDDPVINRGRTETRPWYFSWLWSRRVREDRYRHRVFDDEQRQAEGQQSASNIPTEGETQQERPYRSRLIVLVGGVSLALLVTGLGYQIFNTIFNDNPVQRYFDLPVIEVVADARTPKPNAAITKQPDVVDSLLDRIGKLENELLILQRKDQREAENRQQITDKLSHLSDQVSQNTTVSTELSEQAQKQQQALEDRIDTFFGNTRLQQQDRDQQLSELTRRVEVLAENPVLQPTKDPPNESTQTANTLPFQLLAIDYLANTHYATLWWRGATTHLSQNETLAGWLVETIDPPMQRVVFKRGSQRLAQTATE